MTIGERLEEARKRQGISIREAAEATKIRGDYLLAMEDNSMNISLPEIYRRGFLKNYARFLKLDPAKILTDYEARERGNAANNHGAHAHTPGHGGSSNRGNASGERDPAAPKSEGRGLFGRMELPSTGGEEPAQIPSEPHRKEPPRSPSLNLQDNTLYLKIAAGVAAFAVLVVLVILLVGLLRSSDADDTSSPAGTSQSTATSPANTANASSDTSTPSAPLAGPQTLTFRIKDSVTLIIDQVDPAERLYSGTVQAGEVLAIERTGPITVRFTNGTAFEVEKPDGQVVRTNSPTVGRIVIP